MTNKYTFLIAICVSVFSATAPQYLNYLQNGPDEDTAVLSNIAGNKYLPPVTTTAAPVLHKQFYTISAPNNEEKIQSTKTLLLGRPQQNYRVIFVKAPLPENDNIKYEVEFAPQSEKTVIYVLSKKENDLNAEDIATPTPTKPSKPEVFFIKYKTNEEAESAQKEIKDQYKELGGTDDESVDINAPLASVVGSLDSLAMNGGYEYKQIESGESLSTSGYF